MFFLNLCGPSFHSGAVTLNIKDTPDKLKIFPSVGFKILRASLSFVRSSREYKVKCTQNMTFDQSWRVMRDPWAVNPPPPLHPVVNITERRGEGVIILLKYQLSPLWFSIQLFSEPRMVNIVVIEY